METDRKNDILENATDHRHSSLVFIFENVINAMSLRQISLNKNKTDTKYIRNRYV